MNLTILPNLQKLLLKATEEVIINPYKVKEIAVPQDNSTNLILISIIGVMALWIIFEKLSNRPAKTTKMLKSDKSIDRLKNLMEEREANASSVKEVPTQESFQSIKGDVIKDKNILTQYQEGTGSGITEIEEQLKNDPDNLDLLDWLAFMYYSNNKLKDAEKAYLKALSIKEDTPTHHYYLGSTYFKLEDYTKASLHWNRVIELKPGSKIARKAEDKLNKMKG